MPRALVALALAAVSAAFAVLPASGASRARTGTAAAAADVNGTITLRARYRRGPWKRSLSLELVKLRLTDFTLCAIWNQPQGAAYDCNHAASRQLPPGTTMRLEQNPVAKAVRRADSPGWGMLGASPDAGLGAVLSNLVSGNRRGTFKYRVTLRDRSQAILVRSNTLTVVWR
jgi:hypothetical protein